MKKISREEFQENACILAERAKMLERFIKELSNNAKKEASDGKEILAINTARSFIRANSTNKREKVMKDFIDFMVLLKGAPMSQVVRNTIISWDKEGNISLSFYSYDKMKDYGTRYFELNSSVPISTSMEDSIPVFSLMRYGVSDKICIILNEQGFSYTNGIFNDIMKNNSKSLKKIKGIGNGQVRKLKKAIVQMADNQE